MWSKWSCHFTKMSIRFNRKNFILSFHMQVFNRILRCHLSLISPFIYFPSSTMSYSLPSVHHPWFLYASHPFLSVLDHLHLLLLTHISFSSISYLSNFYSFLLVCLLFPIHQILHLSLHVSIITFFMSFPSRKTNISAGWNWVHITLLQGPPGTKGDKGHSGPSGLVVSMDMLPWREYSDLLYQCCPTAPSKYL